MVKIAVMVSGGGTNLQALIDAETRGEIRNGEISAVISSSPDAYALERAKCAFIPSYVLRRRDFGSAEAYGEALAEMLEQLGIGLVVLAGFMTVLSPAFCRRFCGPGFYGLHVHEAALAKGVKVTGATVHFVSEVVDGGAIILQKAVAVQPGDTPETLQRRVMEEAEWQLLPRAVSLFCEGRLQTQGNLVNVLDVG